MPTSAQLEALAERLSADHLVDGIVFVRWQRGDTYAYGTGADNALYTGFALAQASFAYSVDPTLERLRRVRDLLAGIELLTSVTGTPGVLTRLAFPLDGAWERIGYDPANMDPNNTWTRRRIAGWIFEDHPEGFMFATKTTRDQLVGVVFGLSAAREALNDVSVRMDMPGEDEAFGVIAKVTRQLTARLESQRWSLRDHTGSTHGTSAHRVLGPLKHALRLLDHRVNGTPLRGSLKWFYRWPFAFTWYYRFTRSTFAFNLRLTTGLTLWILGEKDARRWIKRSYSFVRDDWNAWFVAVAEAVGVDVTPRERLEAQRNLEHAVTHNYGGAFRWQKPPDDWRGAPDRVGPSLDVLLPEWLRVWSEKQRSENVK